MARYRETEVFWRWPKEAASPERDFGEKSVGASFHHSRNPGAQGVQMVIAIAVELVLPRASACHKRLAKHCSFLHRLCKYNGVRGEAILKTRSVNVVWLQLSGDCDTEPVFLIRRGSSGCCPFPFSWSRWSSSTHVMSGSLCFFSSYNFCLRCPGVTCSPGWNRSSRWLNISRRTTPSQIHNVLLLFVQVQAFIVPFGELEWSRTRNEFIVSTISVSPSRFWCDFQFNGTIFFLAEMRLLWGSAQSCCIFMYFRKCLDYLLTFVPDSGKFGPFQLSMWIYVIM